MSSKRVYVLGEVGTDIQSVTKAMTVEFHLHLFHTLTKQASRLVFIDVARGRDSKTEVRCVFEVVDRCQSLKRGRHAPS